MDFNGGVKHSDKCKLRTALEWVVFTSSRTVRLEFTRCSTLERIGSDSNLGLRVCVFICFIKPMLGNRYGPARCVSHTFKECVVYHTLTKIFMRGTLEFLKIAH